MFRYQHGMCQWCNDQPSLLCRVGKLTTLLCSHLQCCFVAFWMLFPNWGKHVSTIVTYIEGANESSSPIFSGHFWTDRHPMMVVSSKHLNWRSCVKQSAACIVTMFPQKGICCTRKPNISSAHKLQSVPRSEQRRFLLNSVLSFSMLMIHSCASSSPWRLNRLPDGAGPSNVCLFRPGTGC